MKKPRIRLCLAVIIFVTVQLIIVYVYSMRNFGDHEFVFCETVGRGKRLNLTTLQDKRYVVDKMDRANSYRKMRDTWQAVDEEKTAYVFSAYVIPEDFHTDWLSRTKAKLSKMVYKEKPRKRPPTLMVIGATQSFKTTFYCQLWYHQVNGSSGPTTVMATMLQLDTNDFRYQSTFFACALPDFIVPDAIAITTSKCSTNIHILSPGPLGTDPEFNFTVCLSPMYARKSPAHTRRFIEWVELNRLLGANYFIIYNHSVGDEMNQILKMYEKIGLIKVVPWLLPIVGETNYYAQHAALNDCLLRSRFISKYVVNVDMDEFIIPQGSDINTWSELLDSLPNCSAYRFKSSFYPVSSIHHDQKTTRKNVSDLIVLSNVMHGKIQQYREKYIARTDSVQRLNIHNPTDIRWGGELHVPASIGFVHHYRDDRDTKLTENTAVRDKYGIELLKNVKEPLNVLEKYLNQHVNKSL